MISSKQEASLEREKMELSLLVIFPYFVSFAEFSYFALNFTNVAHRHLSVNICGEKSLSHAEFFFFSSYHFSWKCIRQLIVI
jgi:hypothetical protein